MYQYDSDFFMSNLYEGVYIVNSKRQIVFWNHGSEEITGFKAAEVVNKYCFSNILQHIDSDGKKLCIDGCPLHDTLNTGNVNQNEVYLHHKNGQRIPISVKTIPLYDDHNNVVAAVEVFTDTRYNKEKYEENKELKKLLELDPLTQVYSRRYLDFYLAKAMEEHHNFDTSIGILFVDIDHFKNVNDTYGHNIGDQILKMISGTMKANLRQDDIVGRWGGEEFIVVAKRIDGNGLRLLSEKLRILCKNSHFSNDEHKHLSVTISVGGTLYRHGEPIEETIHRADQFMYESKQAGRDMVTIK